METGHGRAGGKKEQSRDELTSSGFFSSSLALPCLGLVSWPATAEILSIAPISAYFCLSVRGVSEAWDQVTRGTLTLRMQRKWGYCMDSSRRQTDGVVELCCLVQGGQKRGRGMLMVIWTSGLDVPRHTTPEPERCGLLQRPEVGQAGPWRHGTGLVLPASFTCQLPCLPCCAGGAPAVRLADHLMLLLDSHVAAAAAYWVPVSHALNLHLDVDRSHLDMAR